jgi:hypothetical protein
VFSGRPTVPSTAGAPTVSYPMQTDDAQVQLRQGRGRISHPKTFHK